MGELMADGQSSIQCVEGLYSMVVSRSHSQIGQEQWVINVYGGRHRGYFVDVGGYDGIQDSNTFVLERNLGWDGVIIEPDPESFAALKQNRRVNLSSSAVADRASNQSLFLSAGELGGLLDFLQEDVHARERQQLIKDGAVTNVSTTTLTELLDQFESPRLVEYLDLDTEGSELAILKGVDLSRYRFGLLTVEHAGVHDKREKIARYLEHAGYERIEAWFEDWYFSAEAVGELLGCAADEARKRVMHAAAKAPVIRVQNLISEGKAFLDQGEHSSALDLLCEACHERYPNNSYAFALAAKAAVSLGDKHTLERLRDEAAKRYGSESRVVNIVEERLVGLGGS